MTLYSTLFLKPSLRLTRAVGRSENLRGWGGRRASHKKYLVKVKISPSFQPKYEGRGVGYPGYPPPPTVPTALNSNNVKSWSR